MTGPSIESECGLYLLSSSSSSLINKIRCTCDHLNKYKSKNYF